MRDAPAAGDLVASDVLCRSCKVTFEMEDARFRKLRDSGAVTEGHHSLYENRVWVGQCDRCAQAGNAGTPLLQLQHQLADLCDGIRRLEGAGWPREKAIAHLVEQQMDAEESDRGFRAYLELARQQRIAGG